MKRFLVLTLVLLTAAPSTAQVLASGDLDLTELRVEREPTVGVANVVSAVVINNGTSDAFATVQFTYADGQPLAGQQGVDDTNGRTVRAGGRTIINLTWTPDPERVGSQTLRAVLRVQGESELQNNEKILAVFVREPAVNLTLEPPLRLNLSAGSTGFMRYHVRNDGNAPDTFIIDVEGNASWRPRLLGELGVVPPGQTRTGEIAYTAPTLSDDMNLTLRVRATSTQRANMTAAAAAPMLQSNATYAPLPRSVTLTGLPGAAQVLPGENVTFHLTLRNEGTADDVVLLNATLDLNATGWRANVTSPANATGWNGTYVDANGTLALALSPGQARRVQLNVTRLANSTVDTTNLTVLAVSNDSALLRSIQPDAEYRARLDARLVNASPEVGILAIRQPPRTYQGDEIIVGIEVANLGRVAAPPSSLRLELTDGTFILRQTDLRVRALEPGTSVNLTWTNASGDLQGRYRVVARLTPNATNLSVADRDAANNEASAEVLVRRPEFVVRAADRVDVVPGATLVLRGASTGISISNQGLTDETFHVRLLSDAPWLTSEWEVEVPAGGTTVLALEIPVPPYPHVSAVPARVHATLLGRPEFSANATLTFHVDDRQGPDARLLSPTGTTTVGETTRIRVEADDATGIGDASVIVATPGGERVFLLLRPNATNATWLEADYAPARPGTHVLEVRLGDSTPARHGTRLDNLTWVVRERPYRGFQPVGFDEDAALNTAFLKLREAENGTTASVEVDVGDGYRPLPFPYEVRPTGWTEGPHLLRVRATSLGGQTWHGQWNVTLDTTAPALSGLAVTDRGGLTEVTVQADGATRVTARFTGGDADWETELRPSAGRAFTAAVRPPDGWTLVTVLARDAAGNVASLDHDPRARDAPAPAAFALVALALVALALRRR